MNLPARPFQVALRTVHIMAMGLLLGGIAQGAGAARLQAALVLTGASGALLLLLDLAKGTTVLLQGSGLAVLLKLGLLGMGNLFPGGRLAWYLAATAVASVGAHMPGAWRHFSLREGRGGKGSGRLEG